ncbi:MAG TPA: VOC family protein [Candidatus Binatia bacterium]|nr:VOC family protein [Candidatus Binatia bacterium]
MVEINGIAHLFLTVSRFETARNFYRELLTFMGMVPVIDAEQMLYCVGGRTAVGIEPVGEAYANDRFVQQRVGLHHLCFRARSREDVDKFYEKAVSLGAKVVHAPEDGPWAPGYYSVLVEDPDGIRLEMNFVPGKGLLEPKS